MNLVAIYSFYLGQVLEGPDSDTSSLMSVGVIYVLSFNMKDNLAESVYF